MLLSAPAIDIDQPFVNAILGLVAFTLVMTVGVMYATWYERKIVARMQYRLGPTRTGPFGLMQPMADTLKLPTKRPSNRNAPSAWIRFVRETPSSPTVPGPARSRQR